MSAKNEYNLDNQKDLKLVEDQTSNEIVKQGLIETINWFQENRLLYKAELYHI